LLQHITEIELESDPRCTEKRVSFEANRLEGIDGTCARLDTPSLPASLQEARIAFHSKNVKGSIAEQRERALLLERQAIEHAQRSDARDHMRALV
jgi:hypothetical protein